MKPCTCDLTFNSASRHLSQALPKPSHARQSSRGVSHQISAAQHLLRKQSAHHLRLWMLEPERCKNQDNADPVADNPMNNVC